MKNKLFTIGGFLCVFALVLSCISSIPKAFADAAHSPGTNVQSGSTIYFINAQGQKQAYASSLAFTSYGFNSFSNVVQANSADLALPDGPFVPPMDGTIINDDSTIYVVSNGQREGFSSGRAFSGQGYSFSNVVHGDSSYLPTSVPIGYNALTHPVGSLVSVNSTVYMIGCGGFLGFPSEDVLKGWGLQNEYVLPANAADLALPNVGVVSPIIPGLMSPLQECGALTQTGTLSVTKTVGDITSRGSSAATANAETNDQVLYTVIVKNVGATPLSYITVADPGAAGVILNNDVNGKALYTNIYALAAGQSQIFTYTGAVSAATGQNVINTVTAQAVNVSPITASATITVNGTNTAVAPAGSASEGNGSGSSNSGTTTSGSTAGSSSGSSGGSSTNGSTPSGSSNSGQSNISVSPSATVAIPSGTIPTNGTQTIASTQSQVTFGTAALPNAVSGLNYKGTIPVSYASGVSPRVQVLNLPSPLSATLGTPVSTSTGMINNVITISGQPIISGTYVLTVLLNDAFGNSIGVQKFVLNILDSTNELTPTLSISNNLNYSYSITGAAIPTVSYGVGQTGVTLWQGDFTSGGAAVPIILAAFNATNSNYLKESFTNLRLEDSTGKTVATAPNGSMAFVFPSAYVVPSGQTKTLAMVADVQSNIPDLPNISGFNFSLTSGLVSLSAYGFSENGYASSPEVLITQGPGLSGSGTSGGTTIGGSGSSSALTITGLQGYDPSTKQYTTYIANGKYLVVYGNFNNSASGGITALVNGQSYTPDYTSQTQLNVPLTANIPQSTGQYATVIIHDTAGDISNTMSVVVNGATGSGATATGFTPPAGWVTPVIPALPSTAPNFSTNLNSQMLTSISAVAGLASYSHGNTGTLFHFTIQNTSLTQQLSINSIAVNDDGNLGDFTNYTLQYYDSDFDTYGAGSGSIFGNSPNGVVQNGQVFFTFATPLIIPPNNSLFVNALGTVSSNAALGSGHRYYISSPASIVATNPVSGATVTSGGYFPLYSQYPVVIENSQSQNSEPAQLNASLDQNAPPAYTITPGSSSTVLGSYMLNNSSPYTYAFLTGIGFADSNPNADITNLKLYVNNSQIGTALAADSSSNNFQLDCAVLTCNSVSHDIFMPPGSTIKITLVGDISSGAQAGNTHSFSLSVSASGLAADTQTISALNNIVSNTVTIGSNASAQYNIGNAISTAGSGINISSTALPAAVAGQTYSASIPFSYSGTGTLTATWFNLPPGIVGEGLSSNPDTVIINPGTNKTSLLLTGTPSYFIYNFPVTLKIADNQGNSATANMNLEVNSAACSRYPVGYPAVPLPAAVVGQPYTATIQFNCAGAIQNPLNFQLSLPSWMTVSPVSQVPFSNNYGSTQALAVPIVNGVATLTISGTPTAAGTVQIGISRNDAYGGSNVKNFVESLNVNQ